MSRFSGTKVPKTSWKYTDDDIEKYLLYSEIDKSDDFGLNDGDGLTSNANKNKKKLKIKEDFYSVYAEMEKNNPALIANKLFWTRKGNSQKYTCILCNISIQMSTNLKTLKSVILTHIQDKYHKKRFDSYTSAINTDHSNASKNGETEEKIEIKTSTGEKSILTLIEEVEENLSIVNKSRGQIESKKIQDSWDGISSVNFDLDSVYNTYEKSNPVITQSRKYIVKPDDSRHYFCALCKMTIFSPPTEMEFKYNLWVHLNEGTHREKLPDFKLLQQDFFKLKQNMFKGLPSCYKENEQYIEMGPVFRFVKCTLCEVAVSVNPHRFENHIKSREHLENKKLTDIGEMNREPLSNRTRSAFRKFVVRLESPYQKDTKYIHIGKIPGYIICHICCREMVPTQHCVQTHFDSEFHLKNKRRAQTVS